MVAWTRLENWHGAKRGFCGFAVDGRVLWIRTGVLRLGQAPKLERRELATHEAAEAALQTEVAALRRKQFDEEKRVTAPLPKDAELAVESTPEWKWPAPERARRKNEFFEALKAAGIDPLEPFAAQARSSVAVDASGAVSRDADARAAAALKIAKRVLGKALGISSRQQHDGKTLRGTFPSAEAIFERIARS